MPSGGTSSLLDLVRDLWGKSFRISRWYIPGHDGIDLPAPAGTPIRAVADGRVSFAKDARLLSTAEAGRGWAIGGGKVVNIDVGNQLTTQYAHLATISVKEGQQVKRGQIIGTVGRTGGMYGSQQGGPGSQFAAGSEHLHFGLWNKRTGKMVDPTTFLLAARAGWGSDIGNVVRDDWASQGNTLGAWANLVTFPVGHVITEADIDKMMDALQAGGFFKNDVTGEAYAKTRAILVRDALGQEWNKSLQDRLQGSFNQAAVESNALGAAAGSFVDIMGKLSDPGNWIRILSLFAGAGIFAFGAYGVLRSANVAPGARV